MTLCLHSEICAQYLFEKETSELRFPQYQDGSFASNFKLGLYGYLSLLQSKSMFDDNHTAEILPLTFILFPRVSILLNDDSTLPSRCRRHPVRFLAILLRAII